MTQNTPMWKSRWTFLMAATGSAVGLGNIWKFPYIAGEYGGGAFVAVYLICILLIGIPVMMSEVMLGRRGRKNPIDSMLKHTTDSAASPLWSIIGFVGVLSGLLIMMFYSIVAGWSLEYIIKAASGSFTGANTEAISEQFKALTGDFTTQLIAHTTFICMTATIVACGVTAGIGKAAEIMMPLLVILLLVLLGYSAANGDFAGATSFMFSWDTSKLTPEAILTAMGHAFFTLSIGMGAIMAYGSYMTDSASIGKTILTVGFLDTAIALIAGMVIFPLVFAHNLEASSGPGLMFITLPIVFAQIPFGALFGSIFFLLVSVAALSSSISLIEPGVAWLQNRGVTRTKATAILAGTAWVGGLCCIQWSGVFDFLDGVTAKYMLPLGGLLIAIFVGWIMNQKFVREEMGIQSQPLYSLWIWVVRVVAPLGVLLVFADSLGFV